MITHPSHMIIRTPRTTNTMIIITIIMVIVMITILVSSRTWFIGKLPAPRL